MVGGFEMASCVKSNCDGELEERTSVYGKYWFCPKCKNIIDKKCSSCGGEMQLIMYNGSRAANCKKCGSFNYGHR